MPDLKLVETKVRKFHQFGKGCIKAILHAEGSEPLSDMGMKTFRRMAVCTVVDCRPAMLNLIFEQSHDGMVIRQKTL